MDSPLFDSPPLSRTVRRRVLVFYNPTAGQWRRHRLRATLAALRGLGCTVTLRETTHQGHAEEIAAQLTLADTDVVVAAGGDGTINEVANGLLRSPGPLPPLAVIPLGTANVLAIEIGLFGKPRDVARAIAKGGVMNAHLGEANGRRFVMMAGVGFDAHVVAHVDLSLKRKTGKLAYVVETVLQGLRYGFPRCDVEIDGLHFTAASVVICNGKHYGGPFVAAPNASLATPALEICLLERGGWRHVFRYGVALVLGRLAKLPDVKILTGHQIRITGQEGLPVQADGDIITHLPVDIRVADTTLQLVVRKPE